MWRHRSAQCQWSSQLLSWPLGGPLLGRPLQAAVLLSQPQTAQAARGRTACLARCGTCEASRTDSTSAEPAKLSQQCTRRLEVHNGPEACTGRPRRVSRLGLLAGKGGRPGKEATWTPKVILPPPPHSHAVSLQGTSAWCCFTSLVICK